MNDRKYKANYERNPHAGIKFTKPSRTKQAFRDETNINNILDRYKKTGTLPQMIKSNPQYGDFSQVNSYQEALNIVLLAQEQFAGLPAKTREKFGNDPSLFLEFATNPANKSELIKMGLAEKAPLSDAEVIAKAINESPKNAKTQPVKETTKAKEPAKAKETED